MTSFNFNLKSEYLANAYHNDDFYKASSLPQRLRPNIQLQIALGDKAATFYFLVNRAIQTHELTAVTPLPETDFGKNNAEAFKRLDIEPADQWPANEQLKAIADKCLKHERTNEDMIAEGLRGHLTDLQFMHELDQKGAWYDGDEFDPADDFQRWLIENEFAYVDENADDENAPIERTVQLYSDYQDRLTEYFDNYFLGVQIANTADGDAPCVEADICIGGPTCYLKQFFGRGYVLVYAWGGQSDTYNLNADLDDWLDDRFCVYC